MTIEDTILTGKNVVITGGSGGVGAALTRRFAACGATVHSVGRSEIALAELAATAANIHPHIADVTDAKAVKGVFAAAGRVDIVIANAGAARAAPFAKTDETLWTDLIAVNLTAAYLTFHAALPLLSTHGRLIAIASTAGLRGFPYVSAYCAAKHGLVGLVRALAAELAHRPETRMMTVNALCPGYMNTAMTDRSIAAIAAETGRDADAARAILAGQNPQQRLIEPAEVVSAALWLCQPEAQGINGQAITIAGGNP